MKVYHTLQPRVDHLGVAIHALVPTNPSTIGALSVEKLQRLIIDCSYIDQKKRGILDMRETQAPLMELLNRQGLKGRYGAPENGVDLLFY